MRFLSLLFRWSILTLAGWVLMRHFGLSPPMWVYVLVALMMVADFALAIIVRTSTKEEEPELSELMEVLLRAEKTGFDKGRLFVGWNILTGEEIWIDLPAALKGVAIQGRPGEGKGVFLMGLWLQLHRNGIPTIYLTQKESNVPLNWCNKNGIEPLLVNLQPGKKTRLLPPIRLLFEAFEGRMRSVALALTRILVGSGNIEAYGAKHFFQQNAAVCRRAMKRYEDRPDTTLETIANDSEDLIREERDLYKDGAGFPASLRLVEDCHLFHPQPGMEAISIGEMLQKKQSAIVQLDFGLNGEHSTFAGKLFLRALVQQKIRRALKGYQEQIVIILDDTIPILQSGTLDHDAATLRERKGTFWVAAQALGLQAASHKSGGQNPGTLLEEVSNIRVYFDVEPPRVRDLLMLSGQQIVWDESISQTVSPGFFGGSCTESTSYRERVEHGIPLNDMLEIFSTPFFCILVAPGRTPTPIRIPMITRTVEEFDRELVTKPWPDAPKPPPPPPAERVKSPEPKPEPLPEKDKDAKEEDAIKKAAQKPKKKRGKPK